MKTIAILMILASTAFASVDTNQRRPDDLVPRNERMYDAYGNQIGQTDSRGVIYDNYGNRQGEVKSDGKVYDNYGNQIMQIKRRK